MKTTFSNTGIMRLPSQKKREMKIELGKYIITSIIGKGSFSIVKKAVDAAGNQFAVKIYENYCNKNTNFQNEIAALQLLRHPNIIQFKDLIDKEFKLYLVMEYAGDVSLNYYIRNNKNILEKERISFVKKIISAIHHCHSHGVIHRDLKNENIMIFNGEPKLIDFGFSKFYEGELLKDHCGTPRYMSPEILGKKEFDGFKSDCWALGIIVYFVISGGKFPFFGIDEKSLYKNIQNSLIPNDYSFRDDLKSIVSQLLERNPKQRCTIENIHSSLELIC